MNLLPILAVCMAFATTGCIANFPESAEVDGSGDSTGLETQTVSCGHVASLDRYLAGGGGTVSITISDGVGRTIYDEEADLDGEVNDSHEVEGAPGSWTLSVNPEGFAGQFKITLQCL